MHPQIDINLWIVLVAAVAQFFLGWLWYGPLFGKMWATEMKMDPSSPPDKSVMIRGMILGAAGSLLTAYVLAHSVLIWRPSVWGLTGDMPPYTYGFFAGFFTWLGFYIPMDLNTVAWELKSWKFFTINASYHFIMLQVTGMILAYLM